MMLLSPIAARLAPLAQRARHRADVTLQRFNSFNPFNLFNRAPKNSVITARHLTDLIAAARAWRETTNPFRSLDIARAVTLREAFLWGRYSDIQWTYFNIERSDEDLFALRQLRTGALLEMDWQIKLVSEDTGAFDLALAEEQQSALREAYERLDNFYEALEHFALASFRGFAHAEKHRDASGAVTHLEPLDQWNVVRERFRGPWKINPDGLSRDFESLPAANQLDPAGWLIHEVPGHIDWLALVKFVRQNLCEVDWDGFIEIYGLPGADIIGPPDLPPDKIDAYKTASERKTAGGFGAFPNGTQIVYPDSVRSNAPFKDRLDHLSQRLVLAGTGGKLTMLTAPTGLGSGVAEEHAKVFKSIARGEARTLSEQVFQKQFDAPILEDEFPDRPVLAYFELCFREQIETKQVIEDALKLSQAGYQIPAEELSEKTGLTLELKSPVPVTGQQAGGPAGQQMGGPAAAAKQFPIENFHLKISNRSPLNAASRDRLARALADDLQPLRNRLERILQIDDAEILETKLRALDAELPRLLKNLNADPAAARVFEDTFAAAFANGLEKAAAEKFKMQNSK